MVQVGAFAFGNRMVNAYTVKIPLFGTYYKPAGWGKIQVFGHKIWPTDGCGIIEAALAYLATVDMGFLKVPPCAKGLWPNWGSIARMLICAFPMP